MVVQSGAGALVGLLGFDRFMSQGIAHGRGLPTGKAEEKRYDWWGRDRVEVIREKLDPILEDPVHVIADGTFVPCMLLSAGWWERREKAKRAEIQWREPFQAWLFHGFKEWAPSWDISLSVKDEAEAFLFAQLGTGDEADSLLVIVPGEKAEKIRDAVREDFHRGLMGFQAKVTGLLLHRKHLTKVLTLEERVSLLRWSKPFDYCIRLDKANPRHGVEPSTKDKPPIYSGYLWQCVVPKAWWPDQSKVPPLKDVFFIWEHTDFTKPEAVKYNLDSLRQKASYVEKEHGEHKGLVVLQKSSPLVDGEPFYPAQQFYDSILEGGEVLQKGAG